MRKTLREIGEGIKASIASVLRFRIEIMQHPHVQAFHEKVSEASPFFGRHFFRIISMFLIGVALIFILYILTWRAPRPFPEHALVMIERGETLTEISESFKEKGVVRSAMWLRFFIHITGGERKVVAGDYYFPEPVGVLGVVGMLRRGEFGLFPLRITIQEGLSSMKIAELLKEQLPAFDEKDFLRTIERDGLEGYLFPDTYFFMPNADSEEVILIMRENFARQIQPYLEDIEKFKKPINEVIIMASILEAEGKDLESKRVISDILWRRLRLKMPLQVDAPFVYYNGKNSYTLTKEDLQEDHEYNTYVNKGLPPTAITNPGIDSIRAAVTPTPNKYLFFLSDKRGDMHYALDFEGHKRNRELYINSF